MPVSFKSSIYSHMDPSLSPENIYVNNIKKVNGLYRIWRYVFNYDIEEPIIEVAPIRFKGIKKLSLFRYQNYKLFNAALANNEMVFVSPKKWPDPFESYLFQDPITIGKYTFHIACCCFTYDWVESEEAAWLRSGDIQQTVRVEYDFEALCDALRKVSGYDFYFSVVDYSQSRENILSLKKRIPASLDEYLNLMSLKRKAYTYEHELRLFIVSKDSLPQKHDGNNVIDGLHPININLQSVILSACLPPKMPNESEVTESDLLISTDIIKRSHLYDIK